MPIDSVPTFMQYNLKAYIKLCDVIGGSGDLEAQKKTNGLTQDIKKVDQFAHFEYWNNVQKSLWFFDNRLIPHRSWVERYLFQVFVKHHLPNGDAPERGRVPLTPGKYMGFFLKEMWLWGSHYDFRNLCIRYLSLLAMIVVLAQKPKDMKEKEKLERLLCISLHCGFATICTPEGNVMDLAARPQVSIELLVYSIF